MFYCCNNVSVWFVSRWYGAKKKSKTLSISRCLSCLEILLWGEMYCKFRNNLWRAKIHMHLFTHLKFHPSSVNSHPNTTTRERRQRRRKRSHFHLRVLFLQLTSSKLYDMVCGILNTRSTFLERIISFSSHWRVCIRPSNHFRKVTQSKKSKEKIYMITHIPIDWQLTLTTHKHQSYFYNIHLAVYSCLDVMTTQQQQQQFLFKSNTQA